MTAPLVATVGCGAGFAGDRIDPAIDLAASGLVDCVVLECLAERTLVSGLLARAADPGAGHDPRLERRLAPLLPVARANGCRVVTNLGAANPAAAGEAVAELGRKLGLDLRVAVITGDDIAASAASVDWERGARPDDAELLGVHAYLGISGIAHAIAEGADVVVTGRVADSSLFAAPLDGLLGLDDEGLVGATTVGHLLECSGQITGGNLDAAPGLQLDAAQLASLGYPLARFERDGTAVLSVLPGKPARLDALTCTLQLLYEVHDPRRYYTPDVILDLSDVRFDETGDNQVRVSGARGCGRPTTLKAVGFVRRRGQVADVEITYAGSGALDRARRAADTLRLRLAHLGATDSLVDLVGVDSVLGAATIPAAGPPSEVRVHTSARCGSLELAQAVEDEVYALTLSGPAGGSSIRSERRPHLDVVSGTVHRADVHERVDFVMS